MSERKISPRLTLSAAGIPASHSPLLATGKDSMTHDTSGLSSHEYFAKLDHSTRFWKTSQHTFHLGLETFSQTWPTSGTMRNGRCFQLAPLVPHICGKGCSYWPTPRTVMSRIKAHIIPGRTSHANLEEVVAERGETGGYLSPRWIEWLMGFPSQWCETRSTPSETP